MFLISDAYANAAPAQPQGAGLDFLIMIVLFGVIMYFMIIRPQQKRAKEHRQMIEALRAGDEVVTTGGLMGVVREKEEGVIELEIADGVVIKVQPQAVASVLPKGTVKKG